MRTTTRVSVAEGKKDLSRLLKEAAEARSPILIFNERKGELAGALLSPAEYERYELLQGYFEALRLSQKFAPLTVDLEALVRASRAELDERAA
jgi:PHD/YefM family antitoxin component YafN of YafNO toxin-antitoxin module